MRYNRILPILLTVVLACECLSVPAGASSVEDPVFEEQESSEEPSLLEEESIIDSGTFGENDLLTWRLSDAGTLTIGGSGCDSYTDIPWESYKGQIKTLIVEEGFTDLFDGLFTDYPVLAKVSLPSSLEKIGNNFTGCSGITAFTVETGNPVYTAKDGILFSDGGETLVRFPGGKSGSYNIPSSVISIGAFAFSNCNALSEVIFPKKMRSVGDFAFYYCEALKNVVMPERVDAFGGGTFAGCRSLVSGEIPDGVTNIRATFWGCTSLKKVKLPDSLQVIGWHTFLNCSALESVELPDGLKRIDANCAFDGCSSLKHINLPESLTFISGQTFIGSGLTEVTIPSKIDVLNSDIFSGCKDLETVTIPKSVTLIGTDAFKDCSSLKDIYYTGTVKDWKNIRISSGNDILINVAANGHLHVLFRDVPLSHSYQKAVYWATGKGIAAGYTGAKAGLFGVKDDITRGQVVTFLWRAAGKPEAKKSTQTFKDVPVKHAFYKAIQWAVEEGITGGYTGSRKGYFGPNDNCTRGQIATFLWRYEGNPAPRKNTQTFKDVPVKHNFYKAVQWASEQKITAGYKDGRFGVNDTCTRGQCVTFLYRMMN